MSIGSEVSVKVGVKSGAVGFGLNKVRQQFQEFRKGLNNDFANILAFGALEQGIQHVISKASKISDVSRQFGAPAGELQRVSNAAELNGATIDDVGAAWNKLTINQAEAIGGNEELRNRFEDLKIPMSEVAELPVDQLFYRVADAVRDAADRGVAYDSVVKLMGRSSGSLFTTLEQGAETIKKVGDEFGVMSDQAVNDLDDIGDQLQKVGNQVTVEVGGAIIWLTNLWKKTVLYFAQGTASMAILIAAPFKIAAAGLRGESMTNAAREVNESLMREAKVRKDLIDEIEHPAKKDRVKPAIDPEETRAEVSARKRGEEEVAKLLEKNDETRRKAAMDRLSAEEKLQELVKQREFLSGMTAWYDRFGDAVQQLENTAKILELDKEILAQEKQVNEETAKLQKAEAQFKESMAEIDQQAAMLGVDTEREKLALLEQQKEALVKQLSQVSDIVERRELELKLASLSNRILGERKNIASSDDEKRAQLERANERNKDYGRTAEEKLLAKRMALAALDKKIVEEKDPSKVLDLKLERAQTLGEILSSQKKPSESPRVAADNLQRVAGGGGHSVSGTDKHLLEAQTQTGLLRKIAKGLEAPQQRLKLR